MKWRYHVWRATHEAILKPSEAQTVSELKVSRGAEMGQFPVGSINEAVPSFTNSLTRVRER